MEAVPRSPSFDNGTATFHWERDVLAENNWSAVEWALQLTSCLHGTNNAESFTSSGEEPALPFLFLGALRDVGLFHYFNQLAVDTGTV